MDTTRPSLLIRIRNPRDTVAWARFYELYGPLLYRYARARGLSHEESEDIRSTCYQAIVTQIRTFDYDEAKGGFKSWLRTMVNRRVIDRLRKRRVHQLDSNALAELPADSPTADELWDEHWRRQHLRFCIEAARQDVSTKTFEAFQMLAQECRSVPEVCEKLAMTPNQVYKARARVLAAIGHHMATIYPEHFA